MNDLQKELQELKVKVAEFESRIVAEPVAKWQPKGGDWWIDNVGKVLQIASDSRHMKFGTERATQAQAERASVEMRRFNRLLALRDELCGDEVVFDWSSNNSKYQVFFSYGHEKWYCSEICYGSITPYFTSYDLAHRACAMLNSGEVEL